MEITNCQVSQTPSVPIDRWPISEQPRQRLILAGAGSLSLVDIVMLLIGHGNRYVSVWGLAQAVVASIGMNRQLDLASLHAIANLGPVARSRLIAGQELGRRLYLLNKQANSTQLMSGRDVFSMFHHQLAMSRQEVFLVVVLNVRNQTIMVEEIAKGSSESVTFSVKDVFRSAIRAEGSGVICVHNHPSGNCEPSSEDHDLTKQLRGAASILGIRFLDHVIIGHQAYYSFAEGRAVSANDDGDCS